MMIWINGLVQWIATCININLIYKIFRLEKDKVDMNVERVVCIIVDGDLDSNWNKSDEESE